MKLSIITVNYNGAEGLQKTLNSVSQQSFTDFELIVIDGGSTDGSIEVIKEYESLFAHRPSPIAYRWVSERDKGIYDGMNKGVKMASGEYVYFLNGGDCLTGENCVKDMARLLDGADIVTGRVNYVVDGNKVGESAMVTKQDLTMYNMLLRGINHQSSIINRQLQLAHLYDINAKIGADWKFFVETIVLGGANVMMTDCFFANFDRTGISSNTKNVCAERQQMIYSLLPKRVADDYVAVWPHYYEVNRICWLLQHPFWYKIYRAWTTLGRKICCSN